MPGGHRRAPAAPAPARIERRPSLAASVMKDDTGVRIRDLLQNGQKRERGVPDGTPRSLSGRSEEGQALWAVFSRFARRDLRRFAAFLWMMFRLAALSSSALVSLNTCIAFSSPPEMAVRVFLTNVLIALRTDWFRSARFRDFLISLSEERRFATVSTPLDGTTG